MTTLTTTRTVVRVVEDGEHVTVSTVATPVVVQLAQMGPQGPPGPPGSGGGGSAEYPVGGATGAALVKASAADSDVAWHTQTAADVGADPTGTAAAAVAAHAAAADPHPTYTTAAELASALAAYQPLDSDLTAIAALSTTTYGRALLALVDAAAGRTALGLGTASTHAHGDYDAAGAAAAAQAASQPLDSDLTAIAALTTTSFGRSLLALADAAAAQVALGVPPTSRLVSAGSGLTGGGSLAADRTLAADFGTTAGKVTEGNDSRLAAAADLAAHLADTTDAHDASAISVSAAGFNGNLATTDDTVQKVAQKVDDLVIGGGGYATVADEGVDLTARTKVNFVGAGVLAEDDATNSRTKVSIHGPAVAAPNFHGPISSGQVASFGTYQRLYLIPFVGNGVNDFGKLNSALSLVSGVGQGEVRATVEVSGASGVVRFGYYKQTTSTSLGRQADWGTVDASSTGEKALAITGPLILDAGVTYYLAVCIQGNSAVKVTGTNCGSAVQSYGGYAAYPFNQCYAKDSVTGALPSSVSAFWTNVQPQYPAILLLSGDL